jgi:Tfp pilus assembly protein PilV
VRNKLTSERGFALIEVVVSAALLMVVASGVLAGIDGPAAISAKNEARTQAAALAQQDQERLRSKTIAQLSGYTETRSVSLGTPAVSYTVLSTATWIREANDPGSCTIATDDTSGDYLKIASRVTPPGKSGAPIELDSLLTPPPGSVSNTKGTLTVRITNQADAPVTAQSVSISGPVSQTASTNSEGCAVFQNIQVGAYNITFSRVGWLDPSSTNVVNRSTSVTPGAVTVVNQRYAQQGTLAVSVDTKVGAATAVASPANGVTISNIGIPTGTLAFNAPATPTQGSSSFALNVYPFPTGYAVWAGTCTAGDPTLYGLAATSAAPAPGGTGSVTVREPALNLTLYRNGGTYASTHVRIASTDSACSQTPATFTTNASGMLTYPGFPYGNYFVCADDGTSYDSGPFVDTIAAGISFDLEIPVKGKRKRLPDPPTAQTGTCV